MEVMKSSNTQKSAVGMKFLKKDQTPFQKRIASIALKTGEDINDWMQSGQQRKAGNLRTPKYGLRRRPPKFPSPLYQPAASDTPSTLTGSTSRSTYVTLRGSSITPHKSLVSETPYKQVLSDIPDSRRLEIDLTARSMDLTYRSSEKSARTDSDNKTDYLTPTRSYNLPQKSYSSIGGKIKSIRDLHKVSESAPLERTVSRQNLVLKPRHMSSYAGRTRTNLEDGEFNINPEPVPYQPQNFMSSTLLKKVPIPKRHLDSFGGYEYTLGSKRGVILHTDRYQWDAVKSLEGMSQRDRLRAELEYMERLRGIKRRREMLPHRAQLDLLMGGKKVEFSERFDIQREIQKLKSLIMPQNARDLFHGRGFQLPDQHSSLKPRKQPSLDYDSDEDISLSANLQRFPRTVVDPDTGLSKARPFHQQSHLPRINNKNPLGLGSSSPILLSREKRTVDQIKARISIPSEKKGRRPIEVKLHDLVQSRRPGRFSEDGPWTPNLIRQGMTSAYLKRSRTNIQNKFEATMNRAQTQPDAEREKNLKLTTQSETVKRVEIPSAVQLPRSRGMPRTGLESSPDPAPTPLRMGAEMGAELPTVEGISAERPDSPKSRHSQRTRNSVSPVKAATPNPLKGSELPETLPENQRNELKEAFKKLDTDSDGHLMYNQLKTQLPKKLSSQQERFLKEVYDITSSNTFFGVEEFMTMNSLTAVVENLKDEAVAAYNSLDFAKLHDNIVHYVDMFQSVDRGQRGKISIESLQELLTTELQTDLEENQNLWGAILEVVEPNEAIKVSKVEYLAHIPYFLALKKS